MRRRIHNVGQVFNLPALNGQVENLLHGSSRAGFSLLEMFVAAVVFGTAVITFLPMMQTVGLQQRLAGQRLLALREAENLLEHLTPQTWSELTQEFVESQSLSDEAKSRLPQPELDIDVTEPAEPAASKQVTVRVSWTPRPGQAPQSVRLVAWFFNTKEQP